MESRIFTLPLPHMIAYLSGSLETIVQPSGSQSAVPRPAAAAPGSLLGMDHRVILPIVPKNVDNQGTAPFCVGCPEPSENISEQKQKTGAQGLG